MHTMLLNISFGEAVFRTHTNTLSIAIDLHTESGQARPGQAKQPRKAGRFTINFIAYIRKII